MRLHLAFVIYAAVCGSALAQSLECKTVSAPTPGGGMGEIREATARISVADKAAGFIVTGGGCEFNNPRDTHGMIIASRPTDDGYWCKARPADGNTPLTVTAFATACRIKPTAPHDVLIRAPFSNVGLGGGTVALARADRGAVPYSLRVCNTAGGIPIEVDISTALRVRVAFGECLTIDKPQRAFFRAPTSVDIDIEGYYELFKPGAFSGKPSVGPRRPVGNDKRDQIPGPMQTAVATCQKPAPGEPFEGRSYWGYCQLSELKGNKNYRVCFENGFSGQGQKLEYPGGLLPMILDKSLMSKPNPGQLDAYLYMPLEPGGCRDLVGTYFAALLVLDNTWNNQSVSAITYRYIEIPGRK